MMTRLHNVGGALRVVYSVEGKARSIPPRTETEVMLDEKTYNRLKKASDAGDSLKVIELDYQPLEEPVDEPLSTKNSQRMTFTDPAPADPPPTEQAPPPPADEDEPPARVRPKKPKRARAKGTTRVRRSGAVTT